MAEFERRADEGDDNMADLVDEIWKRKLIPGIKKA